MCALPQTSIYPLPLQTRLCCHVCTSPWPDQFGNCGVWSQVNPAVPSWKFWLVPSWLGCPVNLQRRSHHPMFSGESGDTSGPVVPDFQDPLLYVWAWPGQAFWNLLLKWGALSTAPCSWVDLHAICSDSMWTFHEFSNVEQPVICQGKYCCKSCSFLWISKIYGDGVNHPPGAANFHWAGI